MVTNQVMGNYKEIKYFDNYILLKHFICDDYVILDDNTEEATNPTIIYENYKNQILTGYNLAKQLNYCEIINLQDDFIQIKMKKYEMLYDRLVDFINKKLFTIKMCQLLKEMYTNNIIHLDFAPRNIGIDENNDFKLIDLNELNKFTNKQEFLNWLESYEIDFKYDGLGEDYYKACNLFLQSI